MQFKCYYLTNILLQNEIRFFNQWFVLCIQYIIHKEELIGKLRLCKLAGGVGWGLYESEGGGL